MKKRPAAKANVFLTASAHGSRVMRARDQLLQFVVENEDSDSRCFADPEYITKDGC